MVIRNPWRLEGRQRQALQVARTLQDTASCTASVETDPGLVQALPCVFPFNFQERFNTITLPERLARRR